MDKMAFTPVEKITKKHSHVLNKDYIIYSYRTKKVVVFSCMAYTIEDAREKKNNYLRRIA